MRSVFRQRPDPGELQQRVAGWRGKVWIWWPVVFMVTAIAIESTRFFSSDNTSGWIRPWVERFTGHINDTVWAWGHHLARKSGHFTGYGLLCLAWLRAWLLTLARLPRLTCWRWRSVALAVAGTFSIAGLDEWHQTFLPNRTGLFSDVLLDTAGGSTICVVVWILCWRTKEKRDRQG